MNETAQLAKFTAEMTYDKLPPQAVAVAKQCILDWLGVAIRGAHEEPAKILRSVALKMCGMGDATVFDGGSRRIDAYNAAMVNGAASHTLDFDDLHNASIIHLATVVIPAAMAVAEAEHKSGKALLAAVCAGYEAGARAGEAIIPESYFYWHTTGTAGIFGSAAAAASLLGLTAEQTNMCLGSAGTQAAGLWEFLKEGAMSKALHSAKAASAGVFSAYLAKNGFTAASAILEGEKGFCPALSEAPRLEKITENLTYADLKIQHNSFKPYACCKHAHAAIYGAQVLRGRNGITPDIIESVELKVNNITDFLINNPAPQNVYGCKFSIQYCVAAALLYGRVGIDEFSTQVRESEAMQQLMAKITVTKDAEQEAINKAAPDKLASKIIITLKDGTHHAMQVDYPKGDPDNPMSWEESAEKFITLAKPICGRQKAEALCALVKNLDEADDVAAEIKKIFN